MFEIGHFRITFGLFFKASPGAHPFIWKLVFIHMQTKTNFHMKGWAPGLALKKRPKFGNGLFEFFAFDIPALCPWLCPPCRAAKISRDIASWRHNVMFSCKKIWLKREWSHLAGDVGRQASQYSICISMVYPTLLWSSSLYIWETRLFILSKWYGQVLN